MKQRSSSLKQSIYRATAIAFLFQLFGALGAGFIFVTGSIFGVQAQDYGGTFWEIFWHLCFWATDFFFVGFATVLSYLIAGLPALAPSLVLGLYFSHFGGLYGGGQLNIPLYSAFFATPNGGAGGLNIGYIGYLILAVLLGYLIRALYPLWIRVKEFLGGKLTAAFEKSAKKKNKENKLNGTNLLDIADLIVLILIFPIISAWITFLVIQFGVALPFGKLGELLEPVLESAFARSQALGGLLTGAMVGFDLIGPLSLSAFRVAADFAALGSAVPMTVYGLCFAATGWVPFAFFLMNKLFKKGGKLDTDDLNLATAGPINALFDNIKLTVAFSMPFAYRSPFTVIPSYIIGCGVTGVLAGAAGLANSLYLTPEKVALFQNGEIYVSFLQPHMSLGAGTPHSVLLLLFTAVGVLCGAAVLLVLREFASRREKAKGIEIPEGDIVLEMRHVAQELAGRKEDS